MCDCEAGGVSRRTFLLGASAAALGVVLSGCGDGVLGGDPGGTNTGGSFQVTVAQVPTLAVVGGVAFVSGASVPLIVVRTGESTYDVFNRRCPHQGTQISVAGAGFRCPNHGAQFTKAGVWTGGQRTNNLQKLAATFDPVTGILSITS